MFDQRCRQGVRGNVVGANLHEGLDALSLERIGNADGSGLSASGMRVQVTLNFRGTDTVSGDIEHVVGAAKDGDVSVFVFHGHVASDIAAGEELPVALVASGIAPDCAQHAGEGTLQHETSANSGRN